MAFNPEDRFVVIVGNTMIVTTQEVPLSVRMFRVAKSGLSSVLNPDLSIRLHLKVWTNPIIPIATMLTSMQDLYGTAGIGVAVASVEAFTRPSFFVPYNDLDVVQDCPEGQITLEQVALFSNRNNVGEFDVVAHFVRSTIPGLNGCSTHPDDVFGVAVTRIASVWTLAHEVGHVMGLQHYLRGKSGLPGRHPHHSADDRMQYRARSSEQRLSCRVRSMP